MNFSPLSPARMKSPVVAFVAIEMNIREVVGIEDAFGTSYAYFQSIDCNIR